MAATGQTINDRINAARYALAGQGLARCVCKATTEEVIGPKKKHLDYLLACTQEPNVSIPQLANLLIERTNHISWVVVFKALVTVHHLMCYGNERFTQYLASSNYSFQLSSFLDKTAARDFNMSTFIRRYSKYINEKALSYRTLAFDLCKITRGNQGLMRTMPADRLLKTIPILQNQLDALLEFDCSANDLNNGVINACFMLLFRDLIRLFACHNDGIINLLDKYFTLNRKLCRDAFEIYKKFLVRMDKVSDFLRVAEAVGIDKDDIPDLKRAPSSLLDALEQHLQSIESSKKFKSKLDSSGSGLPLPSSGRPSTPNSNSFSVAEDFSITGIKDEEVKKALEEEARVLSQYGMKSSKSKSLRSTGEPSSSNNTEPKIVDDLFGKGSESISSIGLNNNIDKPKKAECSIKLSLASATAVLENSNLNNSKTQTKTAKASDDLFSLLDAPSMDSDQRGSITKQKSDIASAFAKTNSKTELVNNPFAGFSDKFGDDDSANLTETNKRAFQPNLLTMGNSFSTLTQTVMPSQSTLEPSFNQVNPVGSSNINFDSAFGTSNGNFSNSTGLDVLGDLLQPVPLNKLGNQSNVAFGNPKPSMSMGSVSSSGANNLRISSEGSGLFKGDLESTLANLAQNLKIDAVPKNTFKK